jgi:signal peptidase I
MLMNADDRLFVWVDDRPLYFGGLPYQDFQRNGPVVPAFSTSDPGDSLPLGIGCKSTKLQVNRLRVWRDVYYTDQASAPDYRVNIDPVRLNEILDDPATWGGDDARELFASRARNAADLRTLEADQYFPMGDNSPASQDARVWGYPPFVKRDLLLGRGLFLYWPHSLNRPIYGFPDFTRMKFIR